MGSGEGMRGGISFRLGRRNWESRRDGSFLVLEEGVGERRWGL